MADQTDVHRLGREASALRAAFGGFLTAERAAVLERLSAAANGGVLSERDAFAGIHRIAEIGRLQKVLDNRVKKAVSDKERNPKTEYIP